MQARWHLCIEMGPGQAHRSHFKTKMLSYQKRNFHQNDEKVLRPFHLYTGKSQNLERQSLY